MTNRIFVLGSPEVRRRVAAYIVDDAPDGYFVKVVQPEKTRDQEMLAHSCFQDFALHARIDGARASIDTWKSKLKLDFFDETGNDPEFATEWVRCRPTFTPVAGTRYVVTTEVQSRLFPRKLYRAFITFLHARGDEAGVQWSPTSLGREAQAA